MIRCDTAGSTLGLKCGSRTAAAPDRAKETSLPGLSSFGSRRGCALHGEELSGSTKDCILHPAPRNTRVHGETRPAPIYGRTGRAV